MNKLSSVENDYHILLPEIYKIFYKSCAVVIPENLIGTDLLNNSSYIELRNWANELLEEDKVGSLLKKDDFVFMMHQGYIFWYFTANGNPDPIVYSYHEGRFKPDRFRPFSNFIKEFIK